MTAARSAAPARTGHLFKQVLRALLRPLFRIRVSGQSNLLHHRRMLIVANHESLLDGVLLALFLPVDATFIVHTTVANNRLFGRLLRHVPHLAVDSGHPLAMRAAVQRIQNDQPIVIFPEGRLTVTGSLMKVYDGAAFLAARTGATVIAVRIEGAGRSYFGRLAGIYPLKLLPKIGIAIQAPRSIPPVELPSAKLRRRRAGESMRRILLDMLVSTRPARTVFEAFLDARRSFGNDYKLVEEAQLQEHSYGALLGRALELAPALRRLSAQNEIVGVMMPSCSVTLALFLGLSAMRRVPAMLNPSASPEGLRAACAAACMRSIVTSRALFDEAHLARLAAQLPGVRIHLAEDLRPARGPGARLWLAWARRFPRAAAVAQTPDAPAVVLFTSGSEGRPKGVVHSHNSLLSNVAQIRSVADFSPLDKFMMALPLFHAFGLTCGLMLPLVSGCKVFLYPNPLHYRAIPEVVYDRNCTVLFGTSSLLSRYASFAHPYDFGRLRYVVAGAEKLSEDVRQQWIHKFGIRILEGYGVTECAPVVAVNVPMACRTGSVGQIVPGMEYALEPVAGAEGGVLHVRGPNVMMGYLLEDRPGQIQACASRGHGWVCTGDIVQIDEDDFIHVRGRLRRFLRIEGELVSLDLAEQIAAAASPGHRHAVCARADAAGTEHLILFTTAPCLDADRLRAAARAIDATRRAVPPLKRELASLPMLASGKVDYLALEQVAQNIES